jgi:hypothetical protein
MQDVEDFVIPTTLAMFPWGLRRPVRGLVGWIFVLATLWTVRIAVVVSWGLRRPALAVAVVCPGWGLRRTGRTLVATLWWKLSKGSKCGDPAVTTTNEARD